MIDLINDWINKYLIHRHVKNPYSIYQFNLVFEIAYLSYNLIAHTTLRMNVSIYIYIDS